MYKIKRFFTDLLNTKEEHTLLKSLSTDPVKLAPFLEVTTVPKTFVKTFVYDYAEELDNIVNRFTEINELEIKSISICHTDVFVASVVFERSFD